MDELRTLTFVAPSLNEYTIREQNGADEDILTNPVDIANLMNLSKFIAAIVVKTTATHSGKLTVQDALDLPLLDRHCILLQSRIFSLGETLDIKYTWPNSKGKATMYEEDLRNYLFNDYRVAPSDEELEEKPYALPYYLEPSKLKGVEYSLKSGKVISFDCLTGNSEQYIANLPAEKKTRNIELIARNLKLQVNGVFETVTNFALFSVKDMVELRKYINTYDPVYEGLTELENPYTHEKTMYPIIASTSFFFLTEE